MDVRELLEDASLLVPEAVATENDVTVNDVWEYLAHDEREVDLDLLEELGAVRPLPLAFRESLATAAEQLRLDRSAAWCHWRCFESRYGIIRADLTLGPAEEARRQTPFSGAGVLRLLWDIGARTATGEPELVEFNGEADHVHLPVNFLPKAAVSWLVNSLKGVSSRRLRQEFPDLVRHYRQDIRPASATGLFGSAARAGSTFVALHPVPSVPSVGRLTGASWSRPGPSCEGEALRSPIVSPPRSDATSDRAVDPLPSPPWLTAPGPQARHPEWRRPAPPSTGRPLPGESGRCLAKAGRHRRCHRSAVVRMGHFDSVAERGAPLRFQRLGSFVTRCLGRGAHTRPTL